MVKIKQWENSWTQRGEVIFTFLMVKIKRILGVVVITQAKLFTFLMVKIKLLRESHQIHHLSHLHSLWLR